MDERTSDIIAIGQVLARYCRGIDRLDPDLIRSTYWPDAHDDHGPFVGGTEDFVEWAIQEVGGRNSVAAHTMGQSYFEFDGSQAAVETHFAARSHGTGDQANMFRTYTGRYADLFEKRGDEWRIFRRKVLYDMGGQCAALPLDFPHIQAHRSQADTSYHIFSMGKDG